MSDPLSNPADTVPSAHESAGEALLAVATRHGCDTFFGVVSIHNQPLVDTISHQARFVPVRHEAAAVNAADAWARATGRLGVAITSTGTGAGNAAGSLVEALTAGSRVLHVTGQIDSEYVDAGRGVIHETKDQPAMLRAVSKEAIAVRAGDDVGTALARAAQLAVTAPHGPVSVEIPIDLQYQATEVRWPLPAAEAPLPQLDRAVALLERANRPLLWLGGGAVGAISEVAELVELLGCGVLTSNAGRGVVPETDPRVVGNFAASPEGARLLDDADLLLSIGTHFRSNETRHYHLGLPELHVQIDVDPAAIGRAYPVTEGIVGDARRIVGAITTRLTGGADPDWAERVSRARRDARATLRADIGPYAELSDALRRHMHQTSPFVRDVTIPASAWGNRLVDVLGPETNVNARGGGIGQGLAMAIGASLAVPEVPTVLLVGDGGLAVHLGELATLAETSVPVVALVFNDGGYGVLRNLQDHHFHRRSGVDLLTPDFGLLARAFGLAHLLLGSPDEIDAVITEAVALGRPVIVEVDCDRFGAMPKPFVPPVPVRGDR